MKRLFSTFLTVLLATAVSSAASYRFAVIPVEFSDVTFTDLNKSVSSKVQKAQDYFSDQFSPARTFTFDVLPTVKLSYPVSHYAYNTSSLRDAGLDEALRAACIQTKTDFSVYDNDGDGVIENICIITAGNSEADGGGVNCIWPQHIFLHDRGGTLSIGGKTADSFSICTEFATDRIFCHEFAHHFGLQDMYDTDGKLSGGSSKGLWGALSLMDDGTGIPNFCAVELEQLGIGTRLQLSEGHFRLRPISKAKEYLRIDSDNQGEYFLLECRDRSGWDAGIDGAGLVIYHIDRSLADSWYSDMYRRNLTAAERWSLNQVNCRPEHQCARVVEAVPGAERISEIFFPQPGHNTFGSETDPPFRYWSGATSGLALSGITLEADGSISFEVITPLGITGCDVFQDAAIISWAVPASLSVKECWLSWHAVDNPSQKGSLSLNTNVTGLYASTITGLVPQTAYQATVRVVCTDGSIYSKSLEFKTKLQIQGARPYIWLGSLERNGNGSFKAGGKIPLRIYNPGDATAVYWYFDGLRVYPGDDGWWEINSNGILKAEVWRPDGSKDVIVKRITIE